MVIDYSVIYFLLSNLYSKCLWEILWCYFISIVRLCNNLWYLWEPMDAATWLPSWSWMSAITTIRAPWLANRRAVSSPMPLAPPVTMATFPANFWAPFCIELAESPISLLVPGWRHNLVCSYIYIHRSRREWHLLFHPAISGVTLSRPSLWPSFSYYAFYE